MKSYFSVLCAGFIVISLCTSNRCLHSQVLAPAPEESKTKLEFEISWVSMGVEDNESIPKLVADIIRKVDPHEVQILGGAPMPEQPENDMTYVAAAAKPPVGSSADAVKSYLAIRIDDADSKRIEKVSLVLKTSNACKILKSPLISVFAGDSAQISMGASKPFISSLTKVKGDFAVASQPHASSFFDGVSIDVTTGQLSDKKFDLDLIYRKSEIKRVTEVALKDATLQFPEMETESVNLSLPFEVDQTVMVLMGARDEVTRKESGLAVPGLGKTFRNTSIGIVRTQELLLIKCRKSN